MNYNDFYFNKAESSVGSADQDPVPRLFGIRLGQEFQIRIYKILCSTVDYRYDTCWSINAIENKKYPKDF
jgi:hypothetical protein